MHFSKLRHKTIRVVAFALTLGMLISDLGSAMVMAAGSSQETVSTVADTSQTGTTGAASWASHTPIVKSDTESPVLGN